MNEDIAQIIDADHVDVVKLHEVVSGMTRVDIAELFENTSPEKTVQIFRLLPKSVAADVFAYIPSEKQQIIVEGLTATEVGTIMEDLFIDDAVDFIEEMPANVVKRVLQNVHPDTRATINQILRYPEESVGSVMTTEYVDLKEFATVAHAFEHIRATGINKETIYTCYVISRDRMLIGVLSAKELLLAKPTDIIGNIMHPNPVSVHTTDDREVIADLTRKYNLLALPVVDKEDRLVGIVTIDDAIQIIEEENTEDIAKMAAIRPSDEPYLKTSVYTLARDRVLWLMLLMLSATLTGAIISNFEHALALMPSLVAFIPMLTGTGGNAGSQSSTLIIRGMVLDEIHTRDVLKVWWRELRVGFLCGITLATVNYLRVRYLGGQDAMLSLTVTMSLFITILVAKSIGCTLPLIAKQLRIDPTIMAAPLITTLLDATTLVVYFKVAKIILHL